MKKAISRWLPLFGGAVFILAFSFSFTWLEGARLGWGRELRTSMALSTAAGPYAGIVQSRSCEALVWRLLDGAPLILAMLAYSLRPSKATAYITGVGFVLWQVLGFAGARAGV